MSLRLIFLLWLSPPPKKKSHSLDRLGKHVNKRHWNERSKSTTWLDFSSLLHFSCLISQILLWPEAKSWLEYRVLMTWLSLLSHLIPLCVSWLIPTAWLDAKPREVFHIAYSTYSRGQEREGKRGHFYYQLLPAPHPVLSHPSECIILTWSRRWDTFTFFPPFRSLAMCIPLARLPAGGIWLSAANPIKRRKNLDPPSSTHKNCAWTWVFGKKRSSFHKKTASIWVLFCFHPSTRDLYDDDGCRLSQSCPKTGPTGLAISLQVWKRERGAVSILCAVFVHAHHNHRNNVNVGVAITLYTCSVCIQVFGCTFSNSSRSSHIWRRSWCSRQQCKTAPPKYRERQRLKSIQLCLPFVKSVCVCQWLCVQCTVPSCHRRGSRSEGYR